MEFHKSRRTDLQGSCFVAERLLDQKSSVHLAPQKKGRYRV
jgi:hypothetical protein